MKANLSYLMFFDYLRKNLDTKSYKSKKLKILSAKNSFAELFCLFETFESFSIIKNQLPLPIAEWNPISQRPILNPSAPDYKLLEKEFAHQAEIVKDFISTAHEMSHCLLWESFFTGVFNPNFKEFLELSLAFEAFCFWYSDIIITPKIRALTPDKELVHKNSSVSQSHFHPYRVFKALNINQPLEILKIYVKAFLGLRSALDKGGKNQFIKNLEFRILSFYSFHSRSIRSHYQCLKDFQIFDSYYRRFCAVSGIPSLLSLTHIRSEPHKDVNLFLTDIYTRLLPALPKIDREKLSDIRTRRAIQSRAYFAFQLLSVISKKQFFSSNLKVQNKSFDYLIPRIEEYLNKLESTLIKLCAGDSAASCFKELVLHDKFYKLNIQKILTDNNLFMKSRSLIFTSHIDSKIEVGIELDLKSFSPRKTQELIDLILHKYIQKFVSQAKSKKNAKDLGEVLSLTAKMVAATKYLGQQKKTDFTLISNCIDAVLKHSALVEYWSCRLDQISPTQSLFRELTFVYE